MLVGQYRLQRGARTTEGVNTRLFRKVGGKWLIDDAPQVFPTERRKARQPPQ